MLILHYLFNFKHLLNTLERSRDWFFICVLQFKKEGYPYQKVVYFKFILLSILK